MDSLTLIWDRLVRAVGITFLFIAQVIRESYGVILIVMVLILVVLSLVDSAQEGNRDDAAEYACALAGYPRVIEIDDSYFCYKLVDGTDFVRSLEELE